MHDESFPKTAHLRKPAEFERVYAQETYAADGVLVINAAANELGITRLGLSISKKYGPAVVRNRWKRLIREAFRLARSKLPAGLDLVIRPKRGAEPVFANIAASLPQLVARLAKGRGARGQGEGSQKGGRQKAEGEEENKAEGKEGS